MTSIKVNQNEFLKALQIIGKLIVKNPQMPALSNLYLKVSSSGKLQLASTDMVSYCCVTLEIPAQEPFEDIVSIVSYSDFSSYITCLNSTDLEISFGKNKIKISQGENSADFSLSDIASYPKLDLLNEDSEHSGIIFKTEELKEILKRNLIATSMDTSRPILTGILFVKDADANTVRLVSTDGYRLSLGIIPFEGEWERDFVVSAKALGKFMKDFSTEKISLYVDSSCNQTVVASTGLKIALSLINGDFPPYQRILLQSFQSSLEIDRSQLLQAVKQMSVFARKDSNILSWSVGEKLLITPKNSKESSTKAVVASVLEGDSVVIGFNYRYLEEYLNSIPDEILQIGLNGPLAPVQFKGKDASAYIHVIMPVKLD